MLIDRFEIAALVRGLRRDAALAGGAELAVLEEMIAEIDRGIFGDELRRGLYVTIGDRVARIDQPTELFDQARDFSGAGRIAFDQSSWPWVRMRTFRRDSSCRRLSCTRRKG